MSNSTSNKPPFFEMLYWPHRTAQARIVTVYEPWRVSGQSVRTSDGSIVSDYLYPLHYKVEIDALRLRASNLQEDCIQLREKAWRELSE